jgi:hypothetical protein
MGAGDWLKDSVSPREPEKATPMAQHDPRASTDASASLVSNGAISGQTTTTAVQQRSVAGSVASNASAQVVDASKSTSRTARPPTSPKPPAAATSGAAPLAKSTAGAGAAKLVAAVLLLCALVLGACLALVRYAPGGQLANTVQTCASKIGLPKLEGPGSLGKLLHDMPAMPEMPGMPKVSSATSFLSRPEPTPAVDTRKDVATSNQGMIETIAYGAGAAVTSTIGYGIYWMMTQG